MNTCVYLALMLAGWAAEQQTRYISQLPCCLDRLPEVKFLRDEVTALRTRVRQLEQRVQELEARLGLAEGATEAGDSTEIQTVAWWSGPLRPDPRTYWQRLQHNNFPHSWLSTSPALLERQLARLWGPIYDYGVDDAQRLFVEELLGWMRPYRLGETRTRWQSVPFW